MNAGVFLKGVLVNLTDAKCCPVCDAAPIEVFRARYLEAAKCGNAECGHVYAAGEVVGLGVQEHPEPTRELEQYRNRNKRLVEFWKRKGFLGPNASVLDFGAGAGHIARAVRDFGAVTDLVCIEADPCSQEYVRAEGLKVAGSLSEVTRSFDAILLVEVIEHVDDPVELLKSLKSLLNPEGSIFVSTPCGELRSGNRDTSAYDTSEHIHFFTEKSFRYALRKAGFSKFDFETVPALYPHDPGFVSASIARLKGVARLVRDRLIGYSHLVAFVS